MTNTIYFYKDRPVFGIDIGFGNVKAMQLNYDKRIQVAGYSNTNFDEAFISKGVVTQPKLLSEAILNMFSNKLVGKITTNRVVLSIPAIYTFSRIINLPKNIDSRDLKDAVSTEIQQYLPLASNELYSDFTLLPSSADQYRILSVAVSKLIVESYMTLVELLGLEIVAIEPTTTATNRLFGLTDQHKVPTVLIDVGSISTDITVYDNDLVVSGTVTGGGEQYTDAIKKALSVTVQEASTIKARYGLNLSKKQAEITKALMPLTDEIIKEVRRMVRYFEERINDNKKKIGQVVMLGGGANIPGLSDYLTNILRLPVRTFDPWSTISFGSLQLPPNGEEAIYSTVAGLASLKPEEPFL